MLVSATQQSGWENNVYVLTTTRIFLVAGVVYFCRSLYYLVTRYSVAVTDRIPNPGASFLQSFGLIICECITETSCRPVGTSQEQIGVDISNMASDILSMASIDPDINIDLELGLQQPRRSHQSHRYLYRPRAHRNEVLQQTEASMTQVTSIAIAEPCTDIHSEPAAVGTDNMRFTGIPGGHESILLQKRVPDECLDLD